VSALAICQVLGAGYGFLFFGELMKLQCRHVWEEISEYLDHRLAPEKLADIERHLESCEVCSAILDSTRNVLVLSVDDRLYELPVGFEGRLHAKLSRLIYPGNPANPCGR